MKLKKIMGNWNRFFYQDIPIDGLAYFRIFLGFIILMTFLSDIANASLWWSDEGFHSLTTAKQSLQFFHFNLFEFLPPSLNSLYFLIGLKLIVLVCFILGFQTRIANFLLILLILSFHQRNFFILNSADLLLRSFLLILLFSPCGNIYSLDAYFAKKKGHEKKHITSAWTYRLLQLQISCVYLSTAIAKTKGELWLDGSAVYYATRLEDLTRFWLPLILDNYFSIKLLTWGTLIIEFSLGLLVWIKELRKPIIILGILFHLGIEWTMSIPTFEVLMLISLPLMLGPHQIKIYLDFCKEKVKPYVTRTR